MTPPGHNSPADAFWDGFFDVIFRTFTLDFSPGFRPAPPPPPDFRPGPQTDAENLRLDWERVGGRVWRALGRIEAENPAVSRGLYEKRARENADKA